MVVASSWTQFSMRSRHRCYGEPLRPGSNRCAWLPAWTTYRSPRLTRLVGPARFQTATEFRAACRFRRTSEEVDGKRG